MIQCNSNRYAVRPTGAVRKFGIVLRQKMKAVVSVIGRDRTGIIAAVSGALAERGINIEDISQTVMQNNFVMIMLVDMSGSTVPFDKIGEQLQKAADGLGVTVHVQHEDLFNATQRV